MSCIVHTDEGVFAVPSDLLAHFSVSSIPITCLAETASLYCINRPKQRMLFWPIFNQQLLGRTLAGNNCQVLGEAATSSGALRLARYSLPLKSNCLTPVVFLFKTCGSNLVADVALLRQAFASCATREQRERLVADLTVRRSVGLLVSSRRVGNEMSRRVYVALTATDASTEL